MAPPSAQSLVAISEGVVRALDDMGRPSKFTRVAFAVRGRDEGVGARDDQRDVDVFAQAARSIGWKRERGVVPLGHAPIGRRQKGNARDVAPAPFAQDFEHGGRAQQARSESSGFC